MVISTFEFKKVRQNFDMVHKDILSMFDCNRAYQNVLYMTIGNNLIVQSDNIPKNIPDTLRLMNSKNCDKSLTSIHNGDIVKIFAMYSPTKKRKREGKKWSANISLKEELNRKIWVKRKYVSAGDVIVINEISKNKVLVKKNDGNKHDVYIYGYEFLLHVKNANELRNLIKTGVGRSKSYGAGMSLVIGVQNV